MIRRVATVTGGALLLLGLAGCGGGLPLPGGAASTGDPFADTARRYLTAIKDKNVDAGRALICPELRDAFDRSLGKPESNFGPAITVRDFTVGAPAKDNDKQAEVQVTSTAGTNGQIRTIKTTFLIRVTGDAGCIAGERYDSSEPG